MDDVYLEGATPEGQAVVGHLSVIVDTEGITFLGPEPGERRTVGWDRTSPLEFGPPAALPDGEAVTSLEFAVDGRPLRLLVPSKRDAGGGDGLATVEQGADAAADDIRVEPEVTAFIDTPGIAAPAPVAESPVPLFIETPIVAAPAPVAERPTSVEAEAPAPVVETSVIAGPAPVAESPAPVVETSVVPAPVVETSVIAGPAPVAEAPAPVVIETSVVPAPAPVAENPAAVVDSPPPALATVAASSYVLDRLEADVAVEELEDEETDEDELPPVPRVWHRPHPSQVRPSRKVVLSPSQRMVRLVLVTVLLGLIPMAAGVWYFHLQPLQTRPSGGAPSDAVIASRVGIQPADLPGWSVGGSRMGNPFAAGATSHGAAALRTAEQASTLMARCLHVPLSAVDGAFGMGNAVSQRTAQVTSPSYADPSGNGGAVGSVVDMVKTPQIQQADASVFQDPSLFATCYQPFVQAMLPYAPGGGSAGFATATVQAVPVPVPDAIDTTNGPDTVQVAAFQIARIANDSNQTTTVVTTAIAVFAGRVQATLGTVSNFVFSLDAQNKLVRAVEIRTIGVSQL